MAELHLSRARLRASRGEALSAIAPLLLPRDPGSRAGHAHRILWLLFQNDPDSKRDFLWRDEGNGRYLILSHRRPSDPKGLFELESKPFKPSLEEGDRLRFALRANPVVSTKEALTLEERGERRRGKRVDVVMHALHKIPKGERAGQRERLAQQTVSQWLVAQGTRAGFRLPQEPSVEGYTQTSIERKVGRAAGISVVDVAGVIEIFDPDTFLARLAHGFGSAKAFGYGLMLIRRAA
ncbi:type I-E CRISPR-associated protein Cas6/Cse3/CasE [Filomicrobium sp.]|uniref:type I-E CRISPR-associated protein Cas6/Cse3/CasE n=1 Tax=Filomicrobium sp. TaxID=2024831 RepID=UPI002586F94B|nr:type I-E CRISPR-associated protein Cas6/Cse3/CasE [Filomicrobium sp.]MCV0369518.1 type I-E CRISPR-associated protein Cas6/Cse3/CasE [Filomicrobium sp.]